MTHHSSEWESDSTRSDQEPESESRSGGNEPARSDFATSDSQISTSEELAPAAGDRFVVPGGRGSDGIRTGLEEPRFPSRDEPDNRRDRAPAPRPPEGPYVTSAYPPQACDHPEQAPQHRPMGWDTADDDLPQSDRDRGPRPDHAPGGSRGDVWSAPAFPQDADAHGHGHGLLAPDTPTPPSPWQQGPWQQGPWQGYGDPAQASEAPYGQPGRQQYYGGPYHGHPQHEQAHQAQRYGAPGYAHQGHGVGPHGPQGHETQYGSQGYGQQFSPQYGGYGAPYGQVPHPGPAGKTKVVAGLLQLFLGCFGAGRFYLGWTKIAAAQLAGYLLSLLLVIIAVAIEAAGGPGSGAFTAGVVLALVGYLLMFGIAVWAIVDAIRMFMGLVPDAQGRPLD